MVVSVASAACELSHAAAAAAAASMAMRGLTGKMA
jgi:hypothetical protein